MVRGIAGQVHSFRDASLGILTSWYSHTPTVPSHTESALTPVFNRICVSHIFFSDEIIKATKLLSWFHGLLVLGEASYRVLKQPYGEAHMERN
jgi:hypothetical protein